MQGSLEQPPIVPRGGGARAALVRLGGSMGARMARKVYWIAVAILAGVVAGASFIPGIGAGVGNAFSIFTLWIFAVRLHDIGRSGWWQAAFFVVQILAVVLAAAVGHLAPGAAMGVGLVLQGAFILALGLIPGAPGPNRFGPAPGAPAPV
jgi:uncharacterized membrane protein YhaH (DUF805 family)